MQLERGDVVRSRDPFKLGTDKQRPWLIISNENHPFDGEQYITVAISTKEYDPSLPLSNDIWEIGGVPETSFVGPWAIHSPRIDDIITWQGRLTDSFVDRVVDELNGYMN
jgi:mRNA-degrading endonuclease toxin of MazEF toxin-antitoxin module